MSARDWILYDEKQANLYQEMTLGDSNNNPATIEITNPTDFLIESERFPNNKVLSTLRVEISADRFDQIAIAWCKKVLTRSSRRSSRYGMGSPDFDELHEDAELRTVVEQRLNQDDVEIDLDTEEPQQHHKK